MGKVWLLAILLLSIPVAQAIESNYSIVVQDNGNSLVVIGIKGNGVINIPIQPDVQEIRVKGGLFLQHNQSIEVSIGSTQEAVVLYKTAMLTTKGPNSWHFELSPAAGTTGNVVVAMPKDAQILKTAPNALVESINYTKLIWNNPAGLVEVDYKFQGDTPLSPVATSKPSRLNWLLIIVPAALVLCAVAAVLVLRKTKPSKKDNIIRTLSKNEAVIVRILLQNKGGIKRNQLERSSKLAKSSLANTLNTLERKNIVEIDKTNVTHFIKFTRWFDEL